MRFTISATARGESAGTAGPKKGLRKRTMPNEGARPTRGAFQGNRKHGHSSKTSSPGLVIKAGINMKESRAYREEQSRKTRLGEPPPPSTYFSYLLRPPFSVSC